MPRDSSGNYTLPAGNPVVTQTLITSNWANTTLSDIAAALTDSLSKQYGGTVTGNVTFNGQVNFNNANNAYVKKAGDTISGELVSTSANSFRTTQSGYGCFFRMDASNWYILLTNQNDPYGSWNSLRPLAIVPSTGAVSIDGTGAGASFGGIVSVNSYVAATSFLAKSGSYVCQPGGAIGLSWNNSNAFIYSDTSGNGPGNIIARTGTGGVNNIYQFTTSGDFRCPGSLWSGNAQMNGNGDINGSQWSGGWLSSWLSNQLGGKVGKTSGNNIQMGWGNQSSCVTVNVDNAWNHPMIVSQDNQWYSFVNWNGAGFLAISIGGDYGTPGNRSIPTNSSDINLKNRIADTTVDALGAINQLDTFSYSYKSTEPEYQNGRVYPIGINARQMRDVCPTSAEGNEDDSVVHLIPNQIFAYLIRAVQQLTARLAIVEAKP